MEAKWTVNGWYYVREGKREGPFTSNEMREIAGRTPFTAADEVLLGWRSGEELKFVPTKPAVFLRKPRSKSARSGRPVKS